MLQAVEISLKIKKCQKTVKGFLKEKYQDVLQPYLDILKKVMEMNNLNEIHSLLLISKTNMYKDSGKTQMMFMAAVAELIEINAKNKICKHKFGDSYQQMGGNLTLHECEKCGIVQVCG